LAVAAVGEFDPIDRKRPGRTYGRSVGFFGVSLG